MTIECFGGKVGRKRGQRAGRCCGRVMRWLLTHSRGGAHNGVSISNVTDSLNLYQRCLFMHSFMHS
jgi:hypothetical protein